MRPLSRRDPGATIGPQVPLALRSNSVHVFSVDWPWFVSNFAGLAWTDTSRGDASLELAAVGAVDPAVLGGVDGWRRVAARVSGSADLLLLDLPIGMGAEPYGRGVYARWSVSGRMARAAGRVGGTFSSRGSSRATITLGLACLGAPDAGVVESFPLSGAGAARLGR